jgi:hypothetical protein
MAWTILRSPPTRMKSIRDKAHRSTVAGTTNYGASALVQYLQHVAGRFLGGWTVRIGHRAVPDYNDFPTISREFSKLKFSTELTAHLSEAFVSALATWNGTPMRDICALAHKLKGRTIHPILCREPD